jgi:RNA polymerase sigma factor (sigma-70 family)
MTQVCLRPTVVEEHGVLVSWAVRRLHVPMDGLEDARQGGALGLLVALDRFDITRGSFRAFAGTYVLEEVRKAVGWDRRQRVQMVGLDDFEVAERVARDDDALERAERGDALAAARQFIAELDADEQQIVGWIYGEEWTQTAVAAELGVSKMTISRKVAKIHARARQALAGFGDVAA